MDPQPLAVGLTLANEVIIDRATSKPSIIGMFIGLEVEEFPTTPQRFSVWSVLTHGTGNGIIELRVFSVRTGQQVYVQGGTVHFSDVTDIVNASFRVRTIRFPHPGYFLFRLFVDDLPVPHAMCRLRVYQTEVKE